MYLGLSVLSARAPRIWLIEKLIPCSKSTKVESLHRFRWISSRVTTVPARSAKSSSKRNGCGCNFMRVPALRSSLAAASNSNGPKQMLGEMGGRVDINYQQTSTGLDSTSFVT